MQLHEEYIRRHGLPVPVVRFDLSSRVLLKCSDITPRWRVVTIDWTQADRGPGYFEFQEFVPNHNGSSLARYFHVKNHRKIDVSEYEEFMWDWVVERHQHGVTAVPNRHEMELGTWEILLYICDSWFSEHASYSFYEDAEVSTTEGIGVRKRVEAYRRAFAALPKEVKDIFGNYLLPFTNDTSEWIQRLFKKAATGAGQRPTVSTSRNSIKAPSGS